MFPRTIRTTLTGLTTFEIRRVALNKQEAAKRLIQSAVSMTNAGSDQLAVHVVATSALNLLRELMKVGGEGFTEKVISSALFFGATKKLEGKDTLLPDQPQLNELIDRMATDIEAGHLTDPSELKFKGARKLERQALRHLVDPYNFLKHADKDPLGTLEEADVQPVEATCFAVTAYSLLFPTDTFDEEIGKFLDVHIGPGTSKPVE